VPVHQLTGELKRPMPAKNGIIYVVEDDDSVRGAIKRLIRSAGLEAQTFASGGDFLKSKFRDKDACLVSDIRMPGMSGLKLHQKLIERGSMLPVIFITGFDDEETRSQAGKTGAFGYFRKPVDDQALLDAILLAMSSPL
jgi:two-component system response regulator FixJ